MSSFSEPVSLSRLDADNALNHDLFWTDPMPCSLERMLANHNQSMFEYLAPTRYTNSPKNLHVHLNCCHNRRNQQRAGGPMQPMPAQQQQPRPSHSDTGYMDRVF